MTSRIKLLFAAAILVQPLQYVFTARFGEPYPALTMPSFAGTFADKEGNIRFTNVKCEVLFHDGQTRWFTPDDLLPAVPLSHRFPIMSYMFGPPSAMSQPWAPGSLKARLFPGWNLSRSRNGQTELDPVTTNWLKRRVYDLYPSREPETVIFVWYEYVFNARQVSPSIVEEPFGIREISLQ